MPTLSAGSGPEFHDSETPMSTDRKEETATPVATLSALPIELKELSLDDALYRATPPLRFHVSFDAEDRLYDLDGPTLVLNCCENCMKS